VPCANEGSAASAAAMIDASAPTSDGRPCSAWTPHASSTPSVAFSHGEPRRAEA
jgi:hypothetical protein